MKMLMTKKIFPMKKKKTSTPSRDEQTRPRKSKRNAGSLFKRFVSHIMRDRGSGAPLWRRLSKRNRDNSTKSLLSQDHQPEILKVTPMRTSCEVSLISSVEDRPRIFQITVTHDGKSEVDDSYHTVLNPHRIRRANHFDDDKDYDQDVVEIGSSAVLTQDMTTTDQSCSTDGKKTTSRKGASEFDDEETIYFIDTNEQYMRDMYDVMTRKDTIFYKSLFDTSDTEDDDNDDDDICIQGWENNQNWRNNQHTITDDLWYNTGPSTPLDHTDLEKQRLNTTLDTALLEYDDDESVFSRDKSLPIEITVQF